MRRTKRLVNTDTQRQGAARCMMETGVETENRGQTPVSSDLANGHYVYRYGRRLALSGRREGCLT